MHALHTLNLGATGVQDLSPLASLQTLTCLHIGWCLRLTHDCLRPFKHSLCLRKLCAEKIANDSWLPQMGALESLVELNVCGSRLTDVTPLQALTALTDLHVGG